MKSSKPYPKLHQTIIDNIKKLRIKKNLTSQQVAYKASMSPSEFSKLENGHKPYIEKWLGAIAKALEVDKNELMMAEAENLNNPSYMNPEVVRLLEKQREDFILLFKALDEKDKDKEDMITILKEDKIYWNQKYYRNKKRLEECEKYRNSANQRERDFKR